MGTIALWIVAGLVGCAPTESNLRGLSSADATPQADEPEVETLPASIVTPPADSETCTPSPALALCEPGVAAIVDGAPYSSLEEAIGQAADVVDICPGLYDVNLRVDQPLLLRSASGSPADTILSGGGTHPILLAWADVHVMGLTFRDGWSDYAGGAVTAGTGFIAECSAFEGNYAGYEGGAIQAIGDTLVLTSTFTDNEADYEGGAVSWGDWTSAALVVDGSTFTNNYAGYSGGAIEIGTWADDDHVAISNATFNDNSDAYGDGIVAFGSWGGFTGTIDQCAFSGNDVAIGRSGHLEEGYTLAVTNTTFNGDPGVW